MATKLLPQNNRSAKTCSVEGCGGKHCAKGYCSAHYNRYRKNNGSLSTKTQKRSAPDLKTVRDLLRYDPGTGAFSWKKKVAGTFIKPGMSAGSTRQDGRLVVSLQGALYYCNKIAWYHVTGEWVDGPIAFANGDVSDNRFSNLLKKTKPSGELTIERLKEVLDYDPDTGHFTWKVEIKRGQVKAGDSVGKLSPTSKCRVVAIDGSRYACHRLAWLYFYGVWPKDCIDHINGDFGDNRIVNLREATHTQNMHNRKRAISNSSGVKGVTWCRYKEKWHARISVNRKSKSLGRYDKIEDAALAYRNAAIKLRGEYARFD